MTRSVHLGLDIGGTASRWVACDSAGAEVARGKVAGATGHLFNPAERQRLAAALGAIGAALAARDLRAESLCAGITGYGAAVAGDAKALVNEALGIVADRVTLIDDIVLAYVANFAPGQGHLISAGTGSIGVHISASGQTTRVGGRGILIDDAGSGSWIALQALDLIYRRLDHAGAFTGVEALSSRVFAAVGGESWSDVRQFVYAGDRGRIGGLAVAVAEAAKAGDATALTILKRAGEELARLGQALSERCGTAPVGFVGGVLGLHPIIGATIADCLAGTTLAFNQADAALTAARLHADTAWSELLQRDLVF